MVGLSAIALHLALAAAPAPGADCDDPFAKPNLEAALSCFSDDATVTLQQDPLPQAVFRGKDAVREFLEVILPDLVMTSLDERHILVADRYLAELGVTSAEVEREATRLGAKLQTLTWRFDPGARAKLA